jgi:hypothetical protein
MLTINGSKRFPGPERVGFLPKDVNLKPLQTTCYPGPVGLKRDRVAESRSGSDVIHRDNVILIFIVTYYYYFWSAFGIRRN